MKILNFGSLNIDHVYQVDHIVAPGETAAAQGLQYAAGGKGLNQSIALAKAGAPVFHAGCVGCDGGWLVEMLKEAGVHTSYLTPVDEVNGHAVIQVDQNGQNCILIHGGSNRALTEEQVDETLARFDKDDLVLIQNETSQVAYIARKCLERGIPLAFNPSPFTPELLETVPFEAVGCLLINENEGQALTGCQAPAEIADRLLAQYPQMRMVLTLGGDGVYYADAERRICQPAFAVKAVDTTGAGDTFTGFFLGLSLRGYSIEDALKYACAAAAVSVTRAGAAPSIPELADVERFLDELGGGA